MTNYIKDKANLLRIFTKGGAVSPAQLRKILAVAKRAGVDYIHFGSRQDILFPLVKKNTDPEVICRQLGLNYELDEPVRQNIVSSYVASGITSNTSWVHSDTYHYILEDFHYQPSLKINIVDPAQKLVPLFTGDLNFVASPIDNYWHLYLRCLEQEEPFFCPFLIYSSQVAALSWFVEERLQENPGTGYQELLGLLDEHFDLKESRERLEVPENLFPFYEGFHKMRPGQHWLGLYWRNNQYDIPFLEAMCDLCAATHVGKIGITPWKSFIVKGIPDAHLLQWEKLLGKYGINTRHSSLELYWHLPVIDREAMDLKRFLVRTFDQNDISTTGLSFTIKTVPMLSFSSIIIEKDQPSGYQGEYELFESYTVYHTKKFKPNEQEKVVYAKNVVRVDLPAILIRLSRHYYDQLQMESAKPAPKKEKISEQMVKVHQCRDCLTIYDSRFGEQDKGIAAGAAFEVLPPDYSCSLCGSEKERFQPIVVSSGSYQPLKSN